MFHFPIVQVENSIKEARYLESMFAPYGSHKEFVDFYFIVIGSLFDPYMGKAWDNEAGIMGLHRDGSSANYWFCKPEVYGEFDAIAKRLAIKHKLLPAE
jgi:hypothetical protein